MRSLVLFNDQNTKLGLRLQEYYPQSNEGDIVDIVIIAGRSAKTKETHELLQARIGNVISAIQKLSDSKELNITLISPCLAPNNKHVDYLMIELLYALILRILGRKSNVTIKRVMVNQLEEKELDEAFIKRIYQEVVRAFSGTIYVGLRSMLTHYLLVIITYFKLLLTCLGVIFIAMTLYTAFYVDMRAEI